MRIRRVTIWSCLLAALTAGCLLLAGERVRGIALNTAWLSVAATAIALPLGTLAAVVLVKTNAPARRWLLAGFAVLLFVPLYLQVGGWQAALGVGGWMTPQPTVGLSQPWLDGWRAAIWIHAMAAIPWVVCIVAAGLTRVPAEIEEAAALAAGGWRGLWWVTLPAARSAIAVAAVWSAVSIAAEMTVTDFFQIRTFAEEVYTAAAAGGFQTDNPQADYAAWPQWAKSAGLVAGVGLLAAMTAMVLLPVVAGLPRVAENAAERRYRWHLGQARWLAFAVPALLLLWIAGLPLVSLVYKAGLGSAQTPAGWQRVWLLEKLQAELAAAVGLHASELWQTVSLGVVVATLSVLLGAIVGWHLRTARGAPLVTVAVFSLALSMPGPVLGVATIALLNHPADSILYPLTLAYDRTLLAPCLVQLVRFTPVASLVMAAGFASVPTTIIDAAKADGAGWWSTLLRIALPLNLAMLLAAWLVAFALSAGELAATVLVMPPGPPTLTIRLFSLLHYGVEDRVAAISLVFTAALAMVATVAVWLVGYWSRPTIAKDGNCRRQAPGVI